jgi:hypothetical protein
LGALLSAWGQCPVDPCAELNCDDGDPCTQDSCTDGECFNVKIPGCGESDCGSPNAGSCTSPNGSPACDDAACCEFICANDEYCCSTEWDQICSEAANSSELCSGGDGGGGNTCGDPDAGSCNSPNGSPACDDADCCEAICGSDPFCCNTEWDQICADAVPGTCKKT